MIEETAAAIMRAGRDSRLYQIVSDTRRRRSRKDVTGTVRKQPVRLHHFDAIKRAAANIIYNTNLVTMAAGKYDNGEVVGVRRETLLGLKKTEISYSSHTRRFSRAMLTLESAGFFDRQRRSGERNGKPTGKPSLFLVAHSIFAACGLDKMLDLAKQQKGDEAAAARAHLADAAVAGRATAAVGRAGEPIPAGEYLSGLPPPTRP